VIDREAERAWGELVTGNFFDVLGVRAFRGRMLQPSDDDRGAEPVMVLSSHDAGAARCRARPVGCRSVRPVSSGGNQRDDGAPVFSGGNAIGGRFAFSRTRPERDDQWITIVGVARDMKQRSMTELPQPFVFLPVQQSYQPGMVLHARTAGDPQVLAGDLPRIVREIDPFVPFYAVSLLADHTSAATFTQRLAANLLVVFGALALLLAAVGSYGVLSYLVGQRRREIGIRMAVGASRASVFRLVASSGARLVGAGAVAGFALAFGVGMALQGLLIGVQPFDPVTYLAVFAILTGVAFAACLLPARRAAGLDPLAALRED
jgi:hypothetical protein